MKKVLSILLFILLFCAPMYSQDNTQKPTNQKFNKLLIKTNALADILAVANLGAEINLNHKFSIDLL